MALIIQTLGLVVLAVMMTSSLTFLDLLRGLVPFGSGIGFAGSQLNNVILSDVPPERAGSSSGANTTPAHTRCAGRPSHKSRRPESTPLRPPGCHRPTRARSDTQSIMPCSVPPDCR